MATADDNSAAASAATECKTPFTDSENQNVSQILQGDTTQTPLDNNLALQPFLSIDTLLTCCQLLLSEDSNAFLQVSNLCINPERIISDINSAGRYIQPCLQSKLQDLEKMLAVPNRVDWKPSRRAIADQYPLLLLDRLLDLYGMLTSTCSLWTLTGQEASQLDNIAIEVGNCQKRLFRYLRLSLKPQGITNKDTQETKEPTSDTQANIEILGNNCSITTLTTDIVEAIGKISLQLSSAVRLNLEMAISHMGSGEITRSSNSLVSALCQQFSLCGDNDDKKIIYKSVHDTNSNAASVDQVAPFISSVLGIASSSACTQILASRNMSNVITALQGIRYGLHEFGKQRTFEWTSFLAQSNLPHCQQSLPSECRVTSKTNSKNTPLLPPKLPGSPLNRTESSSLDNIKNFIRLKLGSLSHALGGVYKALGSILGGFYEDPKIQQELVSATVLGLYVSIVGFLFIDELQMLAEWLSPILSDIRRHIKQQSLPVNAETLADNENQTSAPIASSSDTTKITETNQETAAQQTDQQTDQQQNLSMRKMSKCVMNTTALSLKSTPSATALLNILSSPNNLSLTRKHESDAILHFFLPHLKNASSKGSSSTNAPADKINRILVWLLWEGDLTSLYYQLKKHNHGENNDSTSEQQDQNIAQTLEEHIVAAIMNGGQSVRAKLYQATDVFFLPDLGNNEGYNPWSGRGADILHFCQRVSEALSLRYLGEIDFKVATLRDQPHTLEKSPYWRLSLLNHLSHTTLTSKPQLQQASNTKIVEGLPKFLSEFIHETVFYRCPLASVADRLPESIGLIAAVASANALASRLGGLVADFDTRVVGAEYLGETSVLNTHDNHRTLTEIENGLTDLKAQFQAHVEGITERHSNQIRTHSNRLEEQQSAIRKNSGILATQQSILNNLAQEIKKLVEGATDMRNVVESLRITINGDGKSDEQDSAEEKYQKAVVASEARLKSKFELLELELKNFEKNVRNHEEDYKSRSTQAEILMKALNRKIEDTVSAYNETVLDKKIETAAAITSEKEIYKKVEKAIENLDDTVLSQKLNHLTSLCNEELLTQKIDEATTQCINEIVMEKLEKATAHYSKNAIKELLQQETENVNCYEIIKKRSNDKSVAEAFSQSEQTIAACASKIAAEHQDRKNAEIERQLENMALSDNVEDLMNRLNYLASKCNKTLSANQVATDGTIDELRHEVAHLKSSIEKLQTAVKHQTRGFVEAVMQRTRRELSDYLTENLSHCVSSHVLYHLEQQQQQRQKRRFLAWTTPASIQTSEKPTEKYAASPLATTAVAAAAAATPTPNRNPSRTLRQTAPLVRSTHRLPGQAEFDGIADSVSVMEEDSMFPEGFEESIFPQDLVLLDLPNAGTTNNNIIDHTTPLSAAVGTPSPRAAFDKRSLSMTVPRTSTMSSPQSKRMSEIHTRLPLRRM